MRTLDSRTVEVSDDLVLTDHAGGGFHVVYRGAACVCDDGEATYIRAAHFAIDAGMLTGKSVAWIGGGLCVGPRLFAIADCEQTVYEIESALAEFCPDGVRFVSGDWRDTISGEFDVIVYDLGDETPRDELTRFLNRGGIILPLKD